MSSCIDCGSEVSSGRLCRPCDESRARTNLIPGLPPGRAWEGAAQLDRGEARSHAEVWARLHGTDRVLEDDGEPD